MMTSDALAAVFTPESFVRFFVILSTWVMAWTILKRGDRRAVLLRYFRELTLRDAGHAALCASVLIALTAGLLQFGHPWTWGWMSLVSGRAANVATIGIWSGGQVWIIGLSAIIVCAYLPFAVDAEERIFRMGATGRWARAKRSGAFGAAHLLVGIPIAGALGLAGFGWYLSTLYAKSHARYVREGKRDAADELALQQGSRLHFAMNLLIVVSAAVVWVGVELLQ